MLIHERTLSRKLAQPLYFSFHKKEPSINRAEIIGVWQSYRACDEACDRIWNKELTLSSQFDRLQKRSILGRFWNLKYT